MSKFQDKVYEKLKNINKTNNSSEITNDNQNRDKKNNSVTIK
jgi:hypothetical protein